MNKLNRAARAQIIQLMVEGNSVRAITRITGRSINTGADEPVFFSPRTGDRMRGDSITHALPLLLEAAGIGKLTPHALRHGAASLMLADGTPMRVIAEQLGHRETEQVMDHTTVEWAEVATAVHYISHIVDGRAGDLARAAVVEHERYLARHPEPDALPATTQTAETGDSEHE